MALHLREVTVVGLLPRQFASLRKKFKGKLLLHHVEGHQMKSLPLPSCGDVLLVRKFICHSVVERLEPEVTKHWASGSVSSAVKALEGILQAAAVEEEG